MWNIDQDVLDYMKVHHSVTCRDYVPKSMMWDLTHRCVSTRKQDAFEVVQRAQLMSNWPSTTSNSRTRDFGILTHCLWSRIAPRGLESTIYNGCCGQCRSLAENCGNVNGGTIMPDSTSAPPNICSISFCTLSALAPRQNQSTYPVNLIQRIHWTAARGSLSHTTIYRRRGTANIVTMPLVRTVQLSR